MVEEETEAVQKAVQDERARILRDLEAQTNGYGTLSIALFKLKNIINGRDGLSS